ncbi:hypothetical protein MGN70_010042 [Eutypa lata]|nr:hypothetical protein MGN70_010042 [Eutypa lata]
MESHHYVKAMFAEQRVSEQNNILSSKIRFTNSVTQDVLLLAATALPVVNGAIAIGNKTCEGGTHFNVAWIEGTSPCTIDVSISPESSRLCNQNFELDAILSSATLNRCLVLGGES